MGLQRVEHDWATELNQMKITATSFKRSKHALMHSVPPTLQQATANPRLHWRLLVTQRQVWVSLLWGHWSLLLGPGVHTAVLCALPESVFPVLGAGVVAAQRWSDFEEIPHVHGQRRSPNKTVGGTKLSLESNSIPARDAQRTQTNLVHTRTQRPHRDWDRTLSVPWEVWVSSGWLRGQGALGALDPGMACSLLEEVAINPIIQKDLVIRK